MSSLPLAQLSQNRATTHTAFTAEYPRRNSSPLKVNLENLLIVFLVVQICLLPFWDLRQLSTSALCTAIVFVIAGGWRLMHEIKAYYFMLLGFGVMAFLDIWKHNFFFNSNYHLRPNYDWAIYWTYISCLIVLVSYKFKTLSIKVPDGTISRVKTLYIALPISLLILVVYLVSLQESDVNSTSHAVLGMFSFMPKACAMLFFFLFVRYKKWSYFILFVALLALSFTEGSRRVYIAMFVICLTVSFAYIVQKYGHIPGRFRAMLFVSFLGIFFYMNLLRSDMEIEGYEEGNPIGNAINYMMQLRALDTYDNTAYILTNIPSRFRYYYGETYAAIFVQPIPRGIWASKPVGLGGPLGLLRYAGIRDFTKEKWLEHANGTSYSPGFIGEAYANFGKAGIIVLSILFGLGTKLFDRNVKAEAALRSPVQMANSAWYASFFLLLRGDMMMAIYFSLLFYIFLRLWLFVVARY